MDGRSLAWSAHLEDESTDVDLLAERSLPRAWARNFETRANEAAITEVGAEWLTYGELEERSRLAAGRLFGVGLRAGDRVVLSAAASLDLVVAYVGCQRLGLVVVPVNTAYTKREIDHIVADAAPRAAIVDSGERASWLRPQIPTYTPDLPLPNADAPALDEPSAGDLALIAYTSGTTGAPKGAMLSQGNLLASAQAVRIAWRWEAGDRLILALPLFHLHGLGVGLHGTLVTGASAVILPKFSEDDVLDAARDFDGTMFFGVPTMYARLAASDRVAELNQLRLCVSGSAPLPADLHEALHAKSGQVILERYGMTETVMNVSNPYEGERRPGTVGFPLPGVDMRLAGDGEILLRGPNVFSGYWRNAEATADAFSAEGFFRTGDLGRLDDDGYLVINGRAKELIITGGYNVYPREVEDVLRGHPAVDDVAVVGVPSKEWGQTVAAWVIASSPVDEGELRAYAATQLAGFKCPRIVRFVEELPRNALGKVQKNLLSLAGE